MSVVIGKTLISFHKVVYSLDFLNDLATYYTVLPPYYLHFFKTISPTELTWKILSMAHIIIMPEFCSNPPMVIFMQYRMSIIYIYMAMGVYLMS